MSWEEGENYEDLVLPISHPQWPPAPLFAPSGSKCSILIQIPSGTWGQQEQPPACSGFCISEASMVFDPLFSVSQSCVTRCPLGDTLIFLPKCKFSQSYLLFI